MNAKQKRSDGKIKDGYFQYAFGRKPCDTVVTATGKRKSFYEDVVQIGDMEDTSVGSANSRKRTAGAESTASKGAGLYIEGMQLTQKLKEFLQPVRRGVKR